MVPYIFSIKVVDYTVFDEKMNSDETFFQTFTLLHILKLTPENFRIFIAFMYKYLYLASTLKILVYQNLFLLELIKIVTATKLVPW